MLIEFNWQAILWSDSFRIKVFVGFYSSLFFSLNSSSLVIFIQKIIGRKRQKTSTKKRLASFWMQYLFVMCYLRFFLLLFLLILAWNVTAHEKKTHVSFFRVSSGLLKCLKNRDEDCVKDLGKVILCSFFLGFLLSYCDGDSRPCTNTYSLGGLCFFDWHSHGKESLAYHSIISNEW